MGKKTIKKETQDLLWSLLSKGERQKVKDKLHIHSPFPRWYEGRAAGIKLLLGNHNLVSNKEPEELLVVNKTAVHSLYNIAEEECCSGEQCVRDHSQGIAFALRMLFGDKCLLDDIELRNLSQNIVNCDKSENNQLKDNMEGKQLNLLKLLKDCIGKEFYSPTLGVVTLGGIADNCVRSLYWFGGVAGFYTHPDGRLYSDGVPIIFPSRALYKKYPLDPIAAWQEWAGSKTPKWWRAKNGEEYWYVVPTGSICREQDIEIPSDDFRYNYGNYFRTKELAIEAAEGIREYLRNFHEQHKDD